MRSSKSTAAAKLASLAGICALLFTDVALASPYIYKHVAHGLQPAITAPDFKVQNVMTSFSFDATVVGKTGQVVDILLVNQGGSAGSYTLPSLTGPNPADFTATTNCAAIAPKASCSITVSFKPTAIGNRVATMTVNDTLYTFSGTAQNGIRVRDAIYQYYAGGGSHYSQTITTSVAAWCDGKLSCSGNMGSGERGTINYYCGSTLKTTGAYYGQSENGPLPYTLSCP